MAQIKQQDIAKVLNISQVTVSKALRNHPDISKEMKDRVKKAAGELGYTPNFIARDLSSKKSRTLGVVVPDIENTYFSLAIDAMIDTVTEQGYHNILMVSRENEALEKENIRTLLGMRVAGLLVSVSQTTSNCDIFDTVKKMEVPLVFFGREIEGLGFSSVVFDDRKAAVDAMDYVFGLGYRKIAHFAGYSTISIGRERCAGYIQALEKHGVPVSRDWIIEGGFDQKDGYESFQRLHRSNELPEVIFTVNDLVALGVYRAAKEIGLRIPEDLGIIGFGHSALAMTMIPQLTIINQNPRLIGRQAIDLLIKEIEEGDSNEPIRKVLHAELQNNESILEKR